MYPRIPSVIRRLELVHAFTCPTFLKQNKPKKKSKLMLFFLPTRGCERVPLIPLSFMCPITVIEKEKGKKEKEKRNGCCSGGWGWDWDDQI